MISTQGLNYQHFRRFSDMLVVGNEQQLSFMLREIETELKERGYDV